MRLSDKPGRRRNCLACCCLPVLAAMTALAVATYFAARRIQQGVVVTVPADRIQQAIEPAFPVVRQRGIVRVTLSDPHVILVRGSNRIGIHVDARVDLFGKKTTSGTATADAALTYDPRTATLAFTDLHARTVTLDHIDRSMRRSATRLAREAVQGELPKTAAYQLTDATAIERMAKFAVRSVKVEDGQVAVTLGP